MLEQHQFRTSDLNVPDTKSAYIVNMIRDAVDSDLVALHRYLTEAAATAGGVSPSPGPASDCRFCSHLAQHQQSLDLTGPESVHAFVDKRRGPVSPAVWSAADPPW